MWHCYHHPARLRSAVLAAVPHLEATVFEEGPNRGYQPDQVNPLLERQVAD
jgi:hypothetical protein